MSNASNISSRKRSLPASPTDERATIKLFLEQNNINIFTLDFSSLAKYERATKIPTYNDVISLLVEVNAISKKDLAERDNDSYLISIVSFILTFDLDELIRLTEKLSIIRTVRILKLYKMLSDVINQGQSIYMYQDVPICGGTFNLLTKMMEDPEPKADVSMPNWKFESTFKNQLVAFYKYCSELSNETDSFPTLAKFEKQTPVLYGYDVGDLDNGKTFLSGTACCGKSTLLRELEENGIKVFSRGLLGSFSGKAKCPVSISNLHMAISCVSSMKNTIGDRGEIDNPLWVGIMEMCDPKYHSPEIFVKYMLAFLSQFTNVWVAINYMATKGFILIDVRSRNVKARHLKRAEGGDLQRGRIPYYCLTQNMFYYAVARMFGWWLIVSPYDNDEWKPDMPDVAEFMTKIASRSKSLLNPVPEELIISKADKEQFQVFDHMYAKFTNIYK